jgi:hypothetical protein
MAALATPLDADACNKLQTERQSLNVLGVDKYIAKGADWAKANLNAADLNLVKRYLDVYEQLKFRCEKVIPVIEPPDEPDDDGEEHEATTASGGHPPVPNRKSAAGDGAPEPVASKVGPVSTPKSAPLKRASPKPSAASATVGPAKGPPAD